MLPNSFENRPVYLFELFGYVDDFIFKFKKKRKIITETLVNHAKRIEFQGKLNIK